MSVVQYGENVVAKNLQPIALGCREPYQTDNSASNRVNRRRHQTYDLAENTSHGPGGTIKYFAVIPLDV